MGRYLLKFFDTEGILRTSFVLNSISDMSARQTASAMLANTGFSRVEIFDNETLLFLLRRNAAGRAHLQRIAFG